ncbi:hypothetical protein CXG81DRAFT_25303 [Caulochytrium protostelioides]|uniref:Uncharacterized protein n=2 Tax=Caulochytrium protostelioides TaxID=1555241 RepID=A0A4P9X9P8_9FUNG|nr:hypothetical protein CXG81DRAFT_26773 [Caulochytrium protostelioides]RKP02074.1 hypothetical protein CXG81DRAFT_25303 [Caulochytrium protostelioides]|eukprot:RKP00498.1 hypothetical protein CXG81DRAFT_26773 [Caulochytrium protostelioides]
MVWPSVERYLLVRDAFCFHGLRMGSLVATVTLTAFSLLTVVFYMIFVIGGSQIHNTDEPGWHLLLVYIFVYLVDAALLSASLYAIVRNRERLLLPVVGYTVVRATFMAVQIYYEVITDSYVAMLWTSLSLLFGLYWSVCIVSFYLDLKVHPERYIKEHQLAWIVQADEDPYAAVVERDAASSHSGNDNHWHPVHDGKSYAVSPAHYR